MVDTQEFGNQLRDGAPVIVSFNEEIAQPTPSYNNDTPGSKSTSQINSPVGTPSAVSPSQTTTASDQDTKTKINKKVRESIKSCVVAAALMTTAYEQADESATLPWQTRAGQVLINIPDLGPDFYQLLKKRWIKHHYQGTSIDDAMKDFAPNCAEEVLRAAPQN